MPFVVQISFSVFQIKSAVFCHEKHFARASPFSLKDKRRNLFSKPSQMALDKLSGSDRSKTNAESPNTSHKASAFDTRTGVPHAIDSRAGKPNPSSNDGNTNREAPA